MSEPIRIDIGICTYRRQAVVATIASLARLALPFNCTIHVIVADNDETPSAQVNVATAAAEHQLDVTYLHAPARNISVARNACLAAARGDYLAFIDDDETVSPQWLDAMLTMARDTWAEVVLGPVQAVYDANYPAWLVVGDFHSTKPVYVKGKIITGYAGNALIHYTAEALQALRFREDLGIEGGEDSDFFARAVNNGARIAYAPDAIVYEAVPPERATIGWLRKRRRRFGETHAMLAKTAGISRKRIITSALLKAMVCYIFSLFYIYDGLKRRQWMLRGALHMGAAYSA